MSVSLLDVGADTKTARVNGLARICFRSGLLLYLISFFLPAYQADKITVYGWTAAFVTLFSSVRLADSAFWSAGPARRVVYDLVTMLPGWTNVLVPLALVGGRWTKIVHLLTLLAAASSVLSFEKHFTPRIGFFVWLLGLMLILYATAVARLVNRIATIFRDE